MKKEVSPFAIIGIIAVAVIGLGVWFYQQLVYTPPTPRVDLYSHGGGATSAAPPPASEPKK